MKGCHGTKNSAPFGHTDGTHGKIEKEMRKHRKSGGEVESAKSGDDQAEMDMKKKNMEYTKDSNVMKESEEKKAAKGGKMMKRKTGGAVAGRSAFHHGGRMPRASGGGCESNPFTSASKGTAPKDHKVESMTMGRD